MRQLEGLIFKVEWILNSFRQNDFKTYHKTYIVPTKWNILWMLTNICGEGEKFYYDLASKNIDIQIKILNLWGFTKDLWHIKDLKHQEWSIIRREKIYNSIYEIQVIIEDKELLDKFFYFLNNPIRIPALGLDNEVVKIFDIRRWIFKEIYTKEVDRIIFLDDIYNFKFFPFEKKYFLAPKLNIINSWWEIKWNRKWFFWWLTRDQRKWKGKLYFIEFYNWKIIFDKEIKIWELVK